jgi:flagellar hook-length control protein FliK
MRTAQQRDGRVQVRLSPPELGSLRIEISVQHGVLHAKLEAETPTARNLLLDNLPALRERLAQQDMRVEKFDVEVRRDNGGQTGGNGAQDRQADQSAWRDGNRRDRPTADRQSSTARAPRVTPAARISDAELDVRI